MPLNHVAIQGNLTRDPESRIAGSSTVVVFTVANTIKRKEAERTAFVDVEAWGKTGELVQQLIKERDKLQAEVERLKGRLAAANVGRNAAAEEYRETIRKIAAERDALILKNEKLKSVLELIATPKRPDGTYNYSREACEEIARKALQENDFWGVK